MKKRVLFIFLVIIFVTGSSLTHKQKVKKQSYNKYVVVLKAVKTKLEIYCGLGQNKNDVAGLSLIFGPYIDRDRDINLEIDITPYLQKHPTWINIVRFVGSTSSDQWHFNYLIVRRGYDGSDNQVDSTVYPYDHQQKPFPANVNAIDERFAISIY